MFSKLNLVAFCGVLLALFGEVALAGFRCGVVGEFLNVFSSSARHAACSASCTMFGQKTGFCDMEGNCHCSDRDIDLEAFKTLKPSRCRLGEEFCRRTCHAMGKVDGRCKT